MCLYWLGFMVDKYENRTHHNTDCGYTVACDEHHCAMPFAAT